MIASITGWKPRCPKVTAPSMTSSDSSLASNSTISTPSPVPATIRSSCERGNSIDGRVQHVLPIDIADPGAADRAEKRDTGQGQRRRTADQRHDVRVVLQIVAQDRADDLCFIEEPRDEERPDRPVDEPRNQRLLFRRPALALEKAAGDLAGGKSLFLIIDRERKEILPGPGRFRCDGGAQHRRLAIGREHRAVSLAGNLAGLEHETASAPHQLLTINLEHP